MGDTKRATWSEDEEAIACRLIGHVRRNQRACVRRHLRSASQLLWTPGDEAGASGAVDAGAITAYVRGVLQVGDESIPLLEVAGAGPDAPRADRPPTQLRLVVDPGASSGEEGGCRNGAGPRRAAA